MAALPNGVRPSGGPAARSCKARAPRAAGRGGGSRGETSRAAAAWVGRDAGLAGPNGDLSSEGALHKAVRLEYEVGIQLA